MFKIHEKTTVQLNHVATKLDRRTRNYSIIPMYFEFCEVPPESYMLPNSYQPTVKSLLYAITEHYGFPADSLKLTKDSYGDDLVLLYGRPFAIVYWIFENA